MARKLLAVALIFAIVATVYAGPKNSAKAPSPSVSAKAPSSSAPTKSPTTKSPPAHTPKSTPASTPASSPDSSEDSDIMPASPVGLPDAPPSDDAGVPAPINAAGVMTVSSVAGAVAVAGFFLF